MRSSDIKINNKYKSSIRLDSLSDSYPNFIDSLIVHGTLEGTLGTISSELSGSSQRAFTVTGPYGSGKSTLAGLLSGLIGSNKDNRSLALQKIGKSAELSQKLSSAFDYDKGWFVVQHVCGLNRPSHSITKSIISQLNYSQDATVVNDLSDAECIDHIRAAINLASKKRDGVLILLDELGKALDYQSSNDGDLYFFQELADIAQSEKVNVVIIGFLHQAFSQYAKGKTALTQQEWAKVQGRYRDLAYNPTVDESLLLIGDSIEVEEKIKRSLLKKHGPHVKSVLKEFPNSFTHEKSLSNILPLDPIVGLLLGPISRRRFSQNERSIFGFLASTERYGFRWFLENEWSRDALNLYHTELLWKYLDSNLAHLINGSPDGKAWLEAQDSLHRAAQKGNKLHSTIVTVIALTSIFGHTHQLFATKNLIVEYLSLNYSKKQVELALSELEEWALIIFRKRHSAYFIFQGSDIDVNTLILAESESIREGVSWAQECSTPTHILASSHYHKTGTMRWVTTAFLEQPTELELIKDFDKPKSGEPFTSFVLIAEQISKRELVKLSKSYPHLVIAKAENIERLKASAIEAISIKNVFKREEKLAHDHIARQELENRLADSKLAISDELEGLFATAGWFYNGQTLECAPLSKLSSQVADQIFPDSPVIINELVNRSKPSGSANSATNKLMLSMLNHDRVEDLGFDEHSFPPEKGIYLSVLKSKGWHVRTSLGYEFTSSWTDSLVDSYPHSFKLWNSGFEFIKSKAQAVTLADLFDYWMSPPFGLTSGLCRIYGLALLKSLEGKVAYYDKDSTQSFIFIPELDEVVVEKLHKHPHEVAVRYFEIDSVQNHLVRSIAETAQLKSDDRSSILSLAKELVKIIHLLPTWVKKTSGSIFKNESGFQITSEAKALRNHVLRANDPYKLILEDIPSIFSVKATQDDATLVTNELSLKLREAINELTSQHELLTDSFKKIISKELSSDFDSALSMRCHLVAKSAHRPEIKEFASRLNDFIQGKNKIEWVLSTAMGVAERNWTDKHISNGLHEIYNLCRQFRREESFSRMSIAKDSKTIGLISADSDGLFVELEGHVATLSSDIDIDNRVEELTARLEDISEDAKREVLIRALSKYMYPVQSTKKLEADNEG